MDIRYRFAFDSGRKQELAVQLDDETLNFRNPVPESLPDWTALEFTRCPNCPLKPSESPRCPVAVNVVPFADAFKDSLSHDEAVITVEIHGRLIGRRAPMQNAVSGLLGLVMATSGCPILDHMRPMAFTHLPFPSLDETMYRAMSMYLLAQYFVALKGGTPDWTMDGLAALYESIDAVNRAFADRLRAASTRDTNINALAQLDCFASFTAMSIQNKALESFEGFFKPYWEKRG